MSKFKEKQELTGPWRKVHGAIWLIGLAILALKGWWWPGILVLVALSALTEALIMKIAPDAVVTATRGGDGSTATQSMPTSTPQPAAAPIHQADLLPTTCPRCGGPTRGHEVKWTGERSADCPFCGANLPMKSSS